MSLDNTQSTNDMFANSDPASKSQKKASPMKSSGAGYPSTSQVDPADQIQSFGDSFGEVGAE
ncbi:MAG: hypothetical protein ACLGXA_08060 [Acidobacteriota bacterium]